MANPNRPSGLLPTRYLNGSPWNGQVRTYFIDSDDSNAFAIGDPVTLSGSGDGNGIAGVTLATAGTGNPVLGAIVGLGGVTYGAAFADPNNLFSGTLIPATKTKGYYVAVADDPNIIFVVQEGGAHAALDKTYIGVNANLLSGTNNGYVSGWLFNNNTTATTNTLQLQLLGLAQTEDNVFGTYAKWEVRINNHCFKAGTAGV